jgi:uncharacterized DUF497 family protein
MPDFEWDTENEGVHVRKHGIDFSTASRIWEATVFEKSDARHDYGEERFIGVGKVDGRLLVVVYTWRGTSRRIISARKANSRERELYEKEEEQGSRPSSE